MAIERRFSTRPAKIETRADGGQTIVGYAAVFYREGDSATEYAMFDDLVERVAPGAFDAALAERQDVRGLFNHDPSKVLGRLSASTMRLSVDQTGLRYEIDVPDTTTGRDVAESIKRGDITGSSFSFTPNEQLWSRDESRKADVRTLVSVDLYDVGPVTFPAYDGSTAGMRSGDGSDALQAREAWRQRRRLIAVRTRLLTLDAESD